MKHICNVRNGPWSDVRIEMPDGEWVKEADRAGFFESALSAYSTGIDNGKLVVLTDKEYHSMLDAGKIAERSPDIYFAELIIHGTVNRYIRVITPLYRAPDCKSMHMCVQDLFTHVQEQVKRHDTFDKWFEDSSTDEKSGI